MKDQYIAAKERWEEDGGQRPASPRSVDRPPPVQRQVHNWLVLDLGIQPEVPPDQWELKTHGKVENPVTLNWQQFLALPQFKDVSDLHCVTTWSRFDMQFEGWRFSRWPISLIKPKPEASHVLFKRYDGYSNLERRLKPPILRASTSYARDATQASREAEIHVGKNSSPTPIICQVADLENSCLGTDKKIGEDKSGLSSAGPIGSECHPGSPTRLKVQVNSSEAVQIGLDPFANASASSEFGKSD